MAALCSRSISKLEWANFQKINDCQEPMGVAFTKEEGGEHEVRRLLARVDWTIRGRY